MADGKSKCEVNRERERVIAEEGDQVGMKCGRVEREEQLVTGTGVERGCL